METRNKPNKLNPIELVKESYDYPNHAWETRYAADIGKRKLLNVLRYLANPDRYARPKNRVYRSNRPKVNNLWDIVCHNPNCYNRTPGHTHPSTRLTLVRL